MKERSSMTFERALFPELVDNLHLIASISADAVGVSCMDETHLKSAADWASQVLTDQSQLSKPVNSLD